MRIGCCRIVLILENGPKVNSLIARFFASGYFYPLRSRFWFRFKGCGMGMHQAGMLRQLRRKWCRYTSKDEGLGQLPSGDMAVLCLDTGNSTAYD